MAKLPRDNIIHYEHDGKGSINITITDLIRCKDCKHWFNAPVNDEYNSCEEDALIRHKDFFCANGELRGEQNG